jgi:tetratricopeptide (TPR) repeat protein/O-antigen ligase
MNTRLGILCDRIIEAGWLVAAMIIPVYFNTYTFRIFEPDKFSLLRSIALLMVLAWLVGRLERGLLSSSGGIRLSLDILRDPVWLLSWLLVAAYLLTTLLSVEPSTSLWGSYQRLQGAYTLLAPVLIFMLAYGQLRTRAQWERLVTAILLGSWPVALYAVLQHYELDPPVWRGDDPTRVFSTIGNPIFLGGYLVMVIPLTVARLGQSYAALRESRGSRGAHIALLLTYGLLLVMQLAALLFTRSRGPWLGFIAGGILLALLVVAVRRWRGLALAVVIVSVVLAGLLIAFSLPGSPLTALGRGPYLDRLVGILNPTTGTAKVRILIWQSVINVLRPNLPRLPVGFGPDSGLIVLTPAIPPELPRLEVAGRIPDRAHNIVFDQLISTGLFGLLTYLALFSTLFYHGLRHLGLVRGSCWRLAALLAAGSLAGALAPPLIGAGWALSGLGVTAGWLAGLGVYLLWQTFSRAGPVLSDLDWRWLTTAALLAGLAAHLTEASFALVVSATLVVFWAFAALLARAGALEATNPAESGDDEAEDEEPEPDEEDEPVEVQVALGWDRQLAAYGWLSAILMMTLGFSLIRVDIFEMAGSQAGTVLVLAGTWLFASVMLTAARGVETGDEKPAGTGWIAPALGLIGLFVYLMAWAGVLALGGDALTMVVVYYALLLVGVLVMARALPGPQPTPTQFWRWPVGVTYPVLLVAIIAIILTTNVRPVQADVYFGAAESYAAAGRWQESLYLYERAMAMQPKEAVYPQFLAEKYVQWAQMTADPAQRDALFNQARLMAERAQALNPRQVDHTFNLGHLHLIWGQMTEDPGRRQAILDRALFYYQQVAAMLPRNTDVRNEMGLAYQLKGDLNRAMEQFRRALELDPGLPRTYLLIGRLYEQTGRPDQAIAMYEQAAELDPRAVEPYNALGQVYLQQGRLEDALHVNLKAAELEPDNFANHYNLAIIYQRLGQIDAAMAEALQAYNLAPAAQKPTVQTLIQSLGGQP